uniref:PITH domain-containing protein n=2 Tax=Caenorhabditis tropicalis TaxID=1561998 RepID=A0A1I7U9A6_9PELO
MMYESFHLVSFVQDAQTNKRQISLLFNTIWFLERNYPCMSFSLIEDTLCDQQCYGSNVAKCKNKMSQDEQQEEQGYILELSSIIGHISPDRDVTVACTRFNKILINGVDGCNSGCERLLHMDLDQLATSSSRNQAITIFVCNILLYLSHVFYVI